jgi:hypothetical protein
VTAEFPQDFGASAVGHGLRLRLSSGADNG